MTPLPDEIETPVRRSFDISTERDQLMRYIEGLSIPEPMTGCVLWLGPVDRKGYAKGSIHDAPFRVQRVAYMLKHGPIPRGLVTDHKCRVHCCINPDHLRPVTGRVNTLLGVGPSAINAQKTHCKRGHLLGGENVRPSVARSGRRSCRKCMDENSVRWGVRLSGLRAEQALKASE